MRAKLSILLLCLMIPLLSGCQSSRKIETASIIENVSISESGGQIYYTFYVLSSGDKPKLKKYTVNVTGFVVDGKGVGRAMMKKPAGGPWAVTVR